MFTYNFSQTFFSQFVSQFSFHRLMTRLKANQNKKLFMTFCKLTTDTKLVVLFVAVLDGCLCLLSSRMHTLRISYLSSMSRAPRDM